MFKLNPNPTFSATFGLSVPGGKKEQVTIIFKHLPRAELKQFFEELEGKTAEEMLSEIVVGWKGFSEEFSQEALEALCINYHKAGAEIFDAFRREFLDAPAKN
ncbi:phage tail assembly chaperone [Chitinilyticum aquatile]|uniref:phage tail assembly chaperone n=1 Tax=Chitinilyticum aquatile TaxID=362520 RepID=UPI000415F24E|nr:phage tail assembly chaperone [Chitinilyticum aquatile]